MLGQTKQLTPGVTEVLLLLFRTAAAAAAVAAAACTCSMYIHTRERERGILLVLCSFYARFMLSLCLFSAPLFF